MSEIKIFTGNANIPLAEKVAKHLNATIGKAKVTQFSDGETTVEILESVRGKDIYIVQSLSQPVNDNLMEIVVMADALRRASAANITLICPYFGYARQDRRVRSARVAITAKVVADMYSGVGIDRIMTVDLHADQIQGFFSIPVDNVYATPLFLDDIRAQGHENLVTVSPDVGGVVRARAIAKRLDTDLAIIDKRRPSANKAEVMHIIGDVNGKNCVIVDDMIDTAGTLRAAVDALKKNGAAKVFAYASHPVFSGNAIQNIENSQLDEVIITDTMPLPEAAKRCSRIRQISISELIAKAISRMRNFESISQLFPDE